MITVEGSYFRTRLATLRTRLGQFQDCAVSPWRVRLRAKAWLSGRNGRSSNLQQRLRCFQGSGESSVLFPCVSCLLACLSLTCLDAVSRFSFAHTCSSSGAILHHSKPGRASICHLPTTVPLHGSRSLAASLPCRATGWLCLWSSERLYLTSLPALPASECLLPPPTPTCCCCCSSSYLHYYLPPLRYLFCLRQTLPAYPLTSTNPPSQPAISRTRASAARIPSIAFDPDSQPATGPSLTHSLACFTFPRSPSTRGALPASPLLSRGTRRRATPCALGNYPRTTCGTCRPRGDRAPWTTDQAHNAQGKQSTSRLTSSPTIPTHASNRLSTHSPTSPSALPAQGPAVECAQSQQSVLSLSKPNATRRCHGYYPACCCYCCYCFFPPHLTSPYPFPCTDQTSSVHQVPALASLFSVSPWPLTKPTVPRPPTTTSTRLHLWTPTHLHPFPQ